MLYSVRRNDFNLFPPLAAPTFLAPVGWYSAIFLVILPYQAIQPFWADRTGAPTDIQSPGMA